MSEMQKLVVGGGCFWCLEAVYQNIIGVEKVVSGYMGGKVKNPSYKEVCSGTTGHAEVIEISFDESQIDRKALLEIFFSMHDPTTLNRQGNDVGTQYRSVVYYENQDQKLQLELFIKEEASQIWDDPIITEISPLDIFYRAESYHQNYYANNPGQGYCTFVVGPKVAKARSKFTHLLKPV